MYIKNKEGKEEREERKKQRKIENKCTINA